jgi:uncharacterized protein YcbK (DUF882 family)
MPQSHSINAMGICAESSSNGSGVFTSPGGSSMSSSGVNVGYGLILFKRLKRIAIVGAVALSVAAGSLLPSVSETIAAGETRALSLYHVHTKENLTITYMKNGRYIPSAMNKINYFMRDWRKDKAVRIDPKMIDMMWELHADLGSRSAIHIICGYRSAATNKFLKRVGRKVAKHSQHVNGNAIDFYFPDVPTQKIRDSALVRELGGVGYYRTSGGPTGFLHIDSGKIRHWGPRISSSQMASIKRNAKKTIGRRLTKGAPVMDVAALEKSEPKKKNSLADLFGGKKKNRPEASETLTAAAPSSIIYGDKELSELAGLAADASETPARQKSDPVQTNSGEMAALAQTASETVEDDSEAEGEIRVGAPIPRPRLKPIEIMMMAAANMNIEPASAPPPRALRTAKSQKNTSVALIDEEFDALEKVTADPKGKAAEKSDLGIELPGHIKAEKPKLPEIRPIIATAVIEDVNWWPSLSDGDQQVASTTAAAATQTINRDGKGSIDPALLNFATE